jgi:hypothetical protein
VIHLYAPVAGHLSWYYLTTGDQFVYSGDEADSIILLNKRSHVTKEVFDPMVLATFDQIGEIRRGPDVFAWIYRRKINK